MEGRQEAEGEEGEEGRKGKERRERRRKEKQGAQETRQCPEGLSEIPMAAKRCAFCTTQVAAAR